jgi:hypothetical protein
MPVGTPVYELDLEPRNKVPQFVWLLHRVFNLAAAGEGFSQPRDRGEEVARKVVGVGALVR